MRKRLPRSGIYRLHHYFFYFETREGQQTNIYVSWKLGVLAITIISREVVLQLAKVVYTPSHPSSIHAPHNTLLLVTTTAVASPQEIVDIHFLTNHSPLTVASYEEVVDIPIMNVRSTIKSCKVRYAQDGIVELLCPLKSDIH